MALNFGSFFEKLLGDDLRKVASGAKKTMGDFASGVKENFQDISDAAGDLRTNVSGAAGEIDLLSKAIVAYKKRLDELKGVENDLSKTEEERLALMYERDTLEGRLKQAEFEHNKAVKTQTERIKKLDKSILSTNKSFKNLSDLTFENVRKNIVTMKEEFIKTGQTSSAVTGKTLHNIEDLQKEALGQHLTGMFTDFKGTMKGMGDAALKGGSGMIGGFLEELGMAAGPAGMAAQAIVAAIIGGITKAVEQLFELNDAIVKMTRSTGGLIKATTLGTDEFGNIGGTMHSLKTEAIAANISMEQFGEAISGLMSSAGGAAMGNLIGAPKSLKESAEEIRSYGVSAAQFAKRYGADISGTVRNMFMKFGKPIGQVTKALDEAAIKAEGAGLSVKAFVENLTELSAMSAESYFKGGIDGMTKMAEMATRLGVNAKDLVHSVKQLGSITDMFNDQQKAAALGMHNLSRQTAAIFAMSKSGDLAGAAQKRISAIASDMQAQGGISKEGGLNTVGQETAKGLGLSESDVDAITAAARGAKKLNISIEDMLKPLDKLDKETRKRVDAERKENMTLKERWDVATGAFTQAFIDPIAQLFSPMLKGLMSAFEGLMSVITPIGKFLMAAIVTPLKFISSLISSIFKSVGEVFSGIGEKLEGLWKKVEPAFSAVGKALSWIGDIIGKVLAVPLKILGGIIGFIIDVIGWFVDAIKGAISIFADLWESIKGMAGKITDAVTAPFKKLWEWIKPIFQPFIDAFTWITDGLKGWAHKWPLSVLFDGEEQGKPEDLLSNSDAVMAMTNAQIAENMAQPNVGVGNLNPSASIAGNTSTSGGGNAGSKITTTSAGQEMRANMTPNLSVIVKSDVLGTSVKTGITHN